VKKKFLLFLTVLFSHLSLMANPINVVFYGPVSNSQDLSTTKLTSDLFFSQLESLSEYIITDKRDITWQDSFANDVTEPNTLLFYVQIKEIEQGWECTLTAIDSITKKSVSKTHSYDGYYRILMEAKSSLQSLLNDYLELDIKQPTTQKSQEKSNFSTKLTLDNLSGTWQGDNLISKIVILRGGRGFVIYKNGASMNIQVSIEENTVYAQQTSRANASFFPDLPREIALVVAGNAEPIQWTLTLFDENTLIGEKRTLMPVENKAELMTVEVTWKRVL